MLLKLESHQIKSHWTCIKTMIQESFGRPIWVNNLLRSLILNNLQCWVVYIKGDNENTLQGLVFTEIVEDPITSEKILYIRFGELWESIYSDPEYINDIEILRSYARDQGCSEVKGSIEDRSVIDYIKSVFKDDNIRISYNISTNVKGTV